MTEPTDEQVNQLLEKYPGGLTLDQISEVLGVTKARAGQIVDGAVAKLLRALHKRGIHSVSDVLQPRQYGHKSQDQLFS